ncbi:hypothetical protein N9159_00620 [bacterium]|nr:hypothetical protein [bacterium]
MASELVDQLWAGLDDLALPQELAPRREDTLGLLAARIAQFEFEHKHWLSRFRRLGPALVALEDGVYGPQLGAVVAAQQLGHTVAEIQHGFISKRHLAYNSPWFAKGRVSLGWPEVLLAFGPWWAEQTNLPWRQKVIVGRQSTRPSGSIQAPEPRDTLLVIGDAVEFESYLEFARESVAWAHDLGLRVLFRPHPRLMTMARDAAGATVEISDSRLNEVLRRSALVVGSYSTVLFEAIGRVPKIACLDTPARAFFMPESPFPLVKSTDELRLLATSRDATESELPRADYWAPFEPEQIRADLLNLIE